MWVPDTDVPYTRKGVPAEVRVDSLGGKVYHGKVARTAESEDYTSRTMRTEVDLPNKDGLLFNGMYGSMTLRLGKTTTGLTVPTAALVGNEKGSKRMLFVVREGKARELNVLIGRDDGVRAEVEEGLGPDEQVIVGHGAGLADGVPVEVVPQEQGGDAETH
jgi:RND family efflux transporter MFP subunit